MHHPLTLNPSIPGKYPVKITSIHKQADAIPLRNERIGQCGSRHHGMFEDGTTAMKYIGPCARIQHNSNIGNAFLLVFIRK